MDRDDLNSVLEEYLRLLEERIIDSRKLMDLHRNHYRDDFYTHMGKAAAWEQVVRELRGTIKNK